MGEVVASSSSSSLRDSDGESMETSDTLSASDDGMLYQRSSSGVGLSLSDSGAEGLRRAEGAGVEFDKKMFLQSKRGNRILLVLSQRSRGR